MNPNRTLGPSRWGWALLLLVMVTAVCLRFIQLGDLPPGLYRDEAYNGIDALRVLEGNHALFFAANNGREPAYIYLTALAIALLGRTAVAVRVAAAVVGSATTLLVYLMGREWFHHRVGLLAAFLWAITLWPIHLSRIGLRPVLLPFALALAAWLAAVATRRQRRWLWLLAGAAYGLSFYTYLAARFTPLVLAAFVVFLWWRGHGKRLWPSLLWFGVGTAVLLLPWLLLFAQQPDLILGRTGQVSILNSAVHEGSVLGKLMESVWRGLGLFLWRGDDIVRHNPAGRPVFDLVMTLPFIGGLWWCVRHWRRPAVLLLLLWSGVMLGPTVLAEDAPHFLRASGLLPGILLLPALGLDRLWEWVRLPQRVRYTAVPLLLMASLLITVRDYTAYGQDQEVAFLFETSALTLAEQIAAEMPETAVYVDRWFWDEPTDKGWPSVPYVADLDRVTLYRPELGVPSVPPGQPVSVYAWERGDLNFVSKLLTPPALVTAVRGDQARLDLFETPFSLYARYHAQPITVSDEWLADVGHQFLLRDVQVVQQAADELSVTLRWEAVTAVSGDWTMFVHVLGANGLVGQYDAPAADGLWPTGWWKPGLVLEETRHIELKEPFDPARHQVQVGWYDSPTITRLPVYNKDGDPVGDSFPLGAE